MGFGLVNRFIERSQVITTNDYTKLTVLHSIKITVTTAYKSKSSISVFTRDFQVTNPGSLILNY
jgi:hypothetical protein